VVDIAERKGRNRWLRRARSSLSHAGEFLALAAEPLSLGPLLPALVRPLVLGLVLAVLLSLGLLATATAAVALAAEAPRAYTEDRLAPAADATNQLDKVHVRHGWHQARGLDDRGVGRSRSLTCLPVPTRSGAAVPVALPAAGTLHTPQLSAAPCGKPPRPPPHAYGVEYDGALPDGEAQKLGARHNVAQQRLPTRRIESARPRRRSSVKPSSDAHSGLS